MDEVTKPDLSAVYPADLSWRPAPALDASQEKSALLELAQRMHYDPADMLPKFVDFAMELTGGVSAGLSLLETDGTAQVFRWHHLRGLLAEFEGATTPRDFSPCGITLDRDAPTLAVHPERFYDWIPQHLSLPEVMLVPLHLGRSEPLGTLWIVGPTPGHFHAGHARAMEELATFIGIALKTMRTEEELQRSLEQQETLTREMSHRLKNVFAIIDGMIRMSARGSESKPEMAATLSGRLHALAEAHSLVRRSFSDVAGVATDIGEVLRIIVEPHQNRSSGRRKFAFDGPLVVCGEQAIQCLALVFHELATNAAKYGVLGADDGQVAVSWRIDEGDVLVRWSESGGPAICQTPANKGFGSALVQSTVERQFRGALSYDWSRDGLTVSISLPLARLER
jgi:two-component sensor histidine kinase